MFTLILAWDILVLFFVGWLVCWLLWGLKSQPKKGLSHSPGGLTLKPQNFGYQNSVSKYQPQRPLYFCVNTLLPICPSPQALPLSPHPTGYWFGPTPCLPYINPSFSPVWRVSVPGSFCRLLWNCSR